MLGPVRFPKALLVLGLAPVVGCTGSDANDTGSKPDPRLTSVSVANTPQSICKRFQEFILPQAELRTTDDTTAGQISSVEKKPWQRRPPTEPVAMCYFDSKDRANLSVGKVLVSPTRPGHWVVVILADRDGYWSPLHSEDVLDP